MGRTASRELSALRERVGAWRKQGGGRGSRIPDQLWEEAVRVARSSGLYATARAGHFNYQRLKERCGKARVSAEDKTAAAVSGGGDKRADVVLVSGKTRAAAARNAGVGGEGVGADARFIALQMAPGRAGSQTVIELVDRHGDRMRVDVTGAVDVAALVQAFWSRPS